MASGRMFRKLFGSCPGDEGPVETSLVHAVRHAEMYVLEYGFARNSSRLSCRRARLLLFAEDYPETSVGAAWFLYRAVSKKFAPNHVAVEPYRLLQDEVARRDLPGALFSGDG